MIPTPGSLFTPEEISETRTPHTPQGNETRTPRTPQVTRGNNWSSAPSTIPRLDEPFDVSALVAPDFNTPVNNRRNRNGNNSGNNSNGNNNGNNSNGNNNENTTYDLLFQALMSHKCIKNSNKICPCCGESISCNTRCAEHVIAKHLRSGTLKKFVLEQSVEHF